MPSLKVLDCPSEVKIGDSFSITTELPTDEISHVQTTIVQLCQRGKPVIPSFLVAGACRLTSEPDGLIQSTLKDLRFNSNAVSGKYTIKITICYVDVSNAKVVYTSVDTKEIELKE